MRKLSAFLILTAALISVSNLAVAGNGKGLGSVNRSDHDKSEWCGELDQDGVTKGLYGMCVAYCDTGARDPEVRDAYNAKRNPETDPALPCEQEICPCWSETLVDSLILAGISAAQCETDITLNAEANFGSEYFSLYLETNGDATCLYIGSEGFGVITPLNVGKEAACQMDIEDLCAIGL